MTGPKRQGGVALITAILLVALATVAAVSMATREQYDLRRTANVLDADQAYAYAEGVEAWARVALLRDLQDNQVDHPGEAWASQLPAIVVPGGTINGAVTDLQGRFNLNNLVLDGKVSPPDVEQFQRLLQILELPVELADGVVDWLDADMDQRFPNGAEDNDYLLLTPAYRAANRAMASPSELRLIKGFTPEAVNRLLPYVCALPARTALNINTASDVLLRTLVDGMSESEAKQLIDGRDNKTGYESVALFLQQPVLAGRQIDTARLSVNSGYFLVDARVDIGTARSHLYSLLQRDDKGIQTLERLRGTW